MNTGQFKPGNKVNLGKTYSEDRRRNISLGMNNRVSLTKEERRKRNNERRKALSKKHRDAVIEAMGGMCVVCGFNDPRALQIDHVNGDGYKESRGISHGEDYNVKVLKSFLNKENKYQLLCANCNWIKRAENKEHRRS